MLAISSLLLLSICIYCSSNLVDAIILARSLSYTGNLANGWRDLEITLQVQKKKKKGSRGTDYASESAVDFLLDLMTFCRSSFSFASLSALSNSVLLFAPAYNTPPPHKSVRDNVRTSAGRKKLTKRPAPA